MRSLIKTMAFSVVLTVMAAGSAGAEQAEIPDPELRRAIRKSLGLNQDSPITRSDLRSLIAVGAENTGIRDLTGLEHAVNLVGVEFEGNAIESLAPLRGLKQLKEVYIEENDHPLDLEPLSYLPRLEALDLSDTIVEDLSLILGSPELKHLWVTGDGHTDLADFSALTKLESLGLFRVEISSTTALFQLPRLTRVAMFGIRSEVSPLSVIPPTVEELELYNCGLTDISEIGSFSRLRTLELGYNEIVDVSALSTLISLEGLNLKGNRIRDLAPLTSLPRLNSLNVSVNFVRDLTPLKGMSNLSLLHVSGNPLASITPLADLPRLAILLSDRTFLDLSDGSETALAINALETQGASVSRNQQYQNREINFVDARLERLLRTALSLTDDAPITTLDVATLEELNADEWEIESMGGLEHAVNLRELSWEDNPTEDFGPLGSLRQLNSLDLEDTTFDQVLQIGGMAWLREAHLGGHVSSLNGLGNAESLEILNVRGTFSDLSPLRELKHLRSLKISNSAVSDLEPLRNLIYLRELTADDTDIVFLNPLRDKRNLLFLNLENCRIRSVAPLEKYETTDRIDLSGNLIADATPLEGIHLGPGYIDLSDNQIDLGAGSSSKAVLDRLVEMYGVDRVRFNGQQPDAQTFVPVQIDHEDGLLRLAWPTSFNPVSVFTSPDLDQWTPVNENPVASAPVSILNVPPDQEEGYFLVVPE